MTFTIDASVHINALNPDEEGSSESQAFLEQVFRPSWPIFSPTLLVVEVAAAMARIFDDAHRGAAVAQVVRGLPGQIWVLLDEALAREASLLAARCRLRGADAVYAAVTQRYGATLVTRDRQQLDRLRPVLAVLTPPEALTRLQGRESSYPMEHHAEQ
jgi:predicted nucleic acid-binding protein